MTPAEQLQADIILAVDTARAAGVSAADVAFTFAKATAILNMPPRNRGVPILKEDLSGELAGPEPATADVE